MKTVYIIEFQNVIHSVHADYRSLTKSLQTLQRAYRMTPANNQIEGGLLHMRYVDADNRTAAKVTEHKLWED